MPPLSDAEREKLRKKQQARALDNLLACADSDRKFARSLCRKVAARFGKDDELSAILRKKPRIDRSGKPRGRPPKWDDIALIVLLDEYEALRRSGMKQEEALEFMVDRKIQCIGWKGDNREKKLEGKITAARKITKARK